MGKGLWAAGARLSGIRSPSLHTRSLAAARPAPDAREGNLLPASLPAHLPPAPRGKLTSYELLSLRSNKEASSFGPGVCVLFPPRRGSPGTLWRPNIHPRGLSSIRETLGWWGCHSSSVQQRALSLQAGDRAGLWAEPEPWAEPRSLL